MAGNPSSAFASLSVKGILSRHPRSDGGVGIRSPYEIGNAAVNQSRRKSKARYRQDGWLKPKECDGK